eukprot:4145054-Amphidinium_carterae.4
MAKHISLSEATAPLRVAAVEADFLAVVRALEEYQPHEVVSDCKGVVKALQALQTGRRQPKECNRDLEQRALNALLPKQRFRWIKAHLKQADVDCGRITADDFRGNQLGPQLRERPEAEPRARLPAEPAVEPPVAQPRAQDPDAPFQLGAHQRVVKHEAFLQCLDCNRHAGRVKATGKCNFSYMRTQDCGQLKIKKVKTRPTIFEAPAGAANSSGGPYCQETPVILASLRMRCAARAPGAQDLA